MDLHCLGRRTDLSVPEQSKLVSICTGTGCCHDIRIREFMEYEAGSLHEVTGRVWIGVLTGHVCCVLASNWPQLPQHR